MGSQIEHYPQVASTNDVAIARGKAGAAEGTLIIAEHQTAGRGRYGRKWKAPLGKCLLVSVVLRHRLLRDQIALPNLIGAIAIAQVIRITHGLDARIKVPNDVRIEKKKVAGVLTELAYDEARHPFFVLGFGVNVNNVLEDFPPELRELRHPYGWRVPPLPLSPPLAGGQKGAKFVVPPCYVIYSVILRIPTCS